MTLVFALAGGDLGGTGATELVVAASDGVGAGARGRGGNRIQLSMSVTGPWAKLGSDKLADITKAIAFLTPCCAKLAGISCHEDLPVILCMCVDLLL